MKYIIFTVFALIIFCLCLPIWLITWEWDGYKNGWASIIEGLSDMLGID
jgi:hypothetical protein